jgi:catechol 2,3-dioxygenase-like lactoylglutathione lyase family enzyme
MIGAQRVDFIAVPTRDHVRAAEFYAQVLGLEKNPNSLEDWIEFETGNVTLALVNTDAHGREFKPLPRGSIALRVADVEEAMLENAGERRGGGRRRLGLGRVQGDVVHRSRRQRHHGPPPLRALPGWEPAR